jgi:hypothetical protein
METSSIECAKEGYYRTFEFEVFDNIVEALKRGGRNGQ